MTQTNLHLVKRNALHSKAEGEVIELGGKCYQTVSEHDIQNNPNQERLNGNVTVILFFFIIIHLILMSINYLVG